MTSSVNKKAPPRLTIRFDQRPNNPPADDDGKGIAYTPRLNWSGLSQAFALAPEGPCPYLEGRIERKLVTPLSANLGEVSALNWAGFRRSHNLAYRPACQGCNLCQAARVICNDFKLSKSHKRTLGKAKTLKRSVMKPVASNEHFALFEDYVVTRHQEGEMSHMGPSEFRAMIEETTVASVLVEWRDDKDQLVAACLTDVLVDGLSMVYSYFDPKASFPSLGTFMILDLIRFSQEKELPYLYLGYWVPGSKKMDYKARFQPLEIHGSKGWSRLDV